MPEHLKWVLELVNSVSGPAAAMSKSIKALTGELDKLKKAAGAGGFKPPESPFKRFFSSIKSDSGSALESFKKLALSIGEATLSLAKYAAMGAIGAAAFGGYKLATTAYDAATMKEDTLISLTQLFGGGVEAEAKAQKELAKVIDFAGRTNLSTAQAIGITTQMASSFSPDVNPQTGVSELDVAREMIAQLAAVKGGGEETINHALAIINQLKTNQKLDFGDIKQLQTLGISPEKLAGYVSKNTGQSVKSIMGAWKDQSPKDILYALRDYEFEKFGTIVDQRSKSLSGLMSTLQSRPEEMLMDWADTGSYNMLKDTVANFNEALNPRGAGKAVQASLLAFVEDVAGFSFSSFAGKDGTSNAVAFILETIKTVSGVFQGVKAFFESIGNVLRKVGGGDIGVGITTIMEKVGAFFTLAMKVFAKLLDVLVFLFDKALSPRSWGESNPSAFDSARESMLGTASDAGQSILGAGQSIDDFLHPDRQVAREQAYQQALQVAQGFMQGTYDSEPGVMEAMKVYERARDWVGSAFEIHSPSRVFRYFGQMSAEGFAQGIEQGNSNIEASAANMFSAVQRGSRSGPGGNGGSGGVTFGDVNITIEGNADEGILEKIKQGARAALSEAFEEIGWEMGLAPR